MNAALLTSGEITTLVVGWVTFLAACVFGLAMLWPLDTTPRVCPNCGAHLDDGVHVPSGLVGCTA